tara:strand:- start:318 stop:500 length:183 start_codon:yes stop_codon:yes gene_type:complete
MKSMPWSPEWGCSSTLHHLEIKICINIIFIRRYFFIINIGFKFLFIYPIKPKLFDPAGYE